ncbi:MAG: class II aldolase/adducin family protein [Deltaproteobacteria bacterium]|nr:class II aldolase/adducin family protein [Deltaproteobacteria bacterium]
MKKYLARIRRDLVAACRILSHEGLVQGFGHVSARIPDSDLFVLTPRMSLALVAEKDLLVLNLNGEVVQGKKAAPFETPLHTAIFTARKDVGAIARIHARTANYFSVTEKRIDAVHNHGSFFSGGVPVFVKTDLVSTPQLGEEVAVALGEKPAILLRGNGQVTVGRTIPEAVVMAIYLEEAADILYGALQIGTPTLLTGDESSRRSREALPPVDLERAWRFFLTRMERQKSS